MPSRHQSPPNFIHTIKKVITWGLRGGFCIAIFAGIGFAFLLYLGHTPKSVLIEIVELIPSNLSTKKTDMFLRKNAGNFTNKIPPYLDVSFSLPNTLRTIQIASVNELITEIKKANKSSGNLTLILESGIYQLKKTLRIEANNISIISSTGNPKDVIIQGTGMKEGGSVGNLIWVGGKFFVLSGITLQKASHHLIQIAGEHDADFPTIRNCILQDSYQQLIKVSYNIDNKPNNSSDFGLVENCTFQYTAGIGPQYYIGGIDAHAANGWIVRNNLFKDIASPNNRISEFAIHFWRNAHNNIVENNIIEDCDRGIGFGFGSSHINMPYSNKGGRISGNTIIHKNNNDPFADTGIAIANSPNTIIENNYIWLEHDYSRAIEYRFPLTTNVIIRNNTTNKRISSRNGGKASLSNNKTDATYGDIISKHIEKHKSSKLLEALN
jgi:hypothetical protein